MDNEDGNIPIEWRYICAADCEPKRFDVPYHPSEFILVGAMTGTELDQVDAACWETKMRDGDGDSASMDMAITPHTAFRLACRFAIKGFYVEHGGKAQQWLPGDGNRKHNEEVYASWTKTMQNWVKACIAEMNPTLRWAALPFGGNGTDSTTTQSQTTGS